MNQAELTAPAQRAPGTFTDAKNRLWTVRVTYKTARRAYSVAGVDLLKITDPQSPEFQRVSQDQFLLFDLLGAVLETDLAAAGCSLDDLADAIETEQQGLHAGLALFEGVVNFTQPAKAKVLLATLNRALGISQEIEDQAVVKLTEALDSGTLDQALREAMEKTATPGE